MSSKNSKEHHELVFQKMGTPEFRDELIALLKIRSPLIYLTCNEEKRMLKFFKHLAIARGYRILCWDCATGLNDIVSGKPAGAVSDDIKDQDAILDHIIKNAQQDKQNKGIMDKEGIAGNIYILLDYHRFLENDALPTTERKLKQLTKIESSMTSTIVVGPIFVSTPALENCFGIIDFPYPNKEEITNTLMALAGNDDIKLKIPTLEDDAKKRLDELVKAASGLTLNEAQDAYTKSVVKFKSFDIPTILREKQQIIRKKGILEYYEPKVKMEHVGGLKNLVEWFKTRKMAFYSDAEEYGLRCPRGVMIVGTTGSGKSLCAKAVASFYEMPLLRLDFGRLFGSLVGESEATARSAIKLAETVAPCVSGDTVIYTSDAQPRTIRSLLSGNDEFLYTYSLNEKTLKLEKDKIKAVIKQPLKKEMVRISSWPVDIDVTLNHKLMINKNGNFEWIEAKDIRENDLLIMPKTLRNGVKWIELMPDIVGVKVEKIENIGEQDCFDLSIENNHNFFANGILSKNCVLWCDEIEKGLSGMNSSSITDGGTTSRVVSTFLTWMQEKEKEVFIVATANNHNLIPPEFMRAGRFDEIFFVDLPNFSERKDIYTILLKKYKRNPSDFDLKRLSSASEHYSGAEIEKSIECALFEGYSDKKRKITTDDILSALKTFNSLYEMRKSDFDEIRKWAGEKGCRLANRADEEEVAPEKNTFENLDIK